MEEIVYNDVIFRKAYQKDDDDLKAVLRENNMNSWVKLSFEREPSYFLSDNLMGETFSVIVHKRESSKEIMGMYSCSFLPVHINRVPEYIGYLGGLRICQPYRNKLRYVKNGYDSILKLIPLKSTLPFWFTSIASENDPAKKLLEAGLKKLPVYSPVGVMKTIAISVNQGKANGILERVKTNDIRGFIEFYHAHTINYQFSPVLTSDWLTSLKGEQGLSLDDFFVVRKQGLIVGCLAIWDQRKFKQTVVKGYRFPFNKLRLVYNLLTPITKRTPLPKVNRKIEEIYISFVAFDENNQDLIVQVIQDVLSKIKKRGSVLAILGLSNRNPLVPIIENNFHTHIYESCIDTVHFNANDKPLIDVKAVQPEVAIL